MGIEPTYPAWKAGVLPLNYTRTPRIYIISAFYHIVKVFRDFYQNKMGGNENRSLPADQKSQSLKKAIS